MISINAYNYKYALNSSYNICIRKESGYNCVQYTPCSDAPTFGVSGTATSKTGSNCSTDWLEIQGGTTCGGSNSLINRYCGSKFSNVDGGTVDGSVCGTYLNHITEFLIQFIVSLVFKEWTFLILTFQIVIARFHLHLIQTKILKKLLLQRLFKEVIFLN